MVGTVPSIPSNIPNYCAHVIIVHIMQRIRDWSSSLEFAIGAILIKIFASVPHTSHISLSITTFNRRRHTACIHHRVSVNESWRRRWGHFCPRFICRSRTGRKETKVLYMFAQSFTTLFLCLCILPSIAVYKQVCSFVTYAGVSTNAENSRAAEGTGKAETNDQLISRKTRWVPLTSRG